MPDSFEQAKFAAFLVVPTWPRVLSVKQRGHDPVALPYPQVARSQGMIPPRVCAKVRPSVFMQTSHMRRAPRHKATLPLLGDARHCTLTCHSGGDELTVGNSKGAKKPRPSKAARVERPRAQIAVSKRDRAAGEWFTKLVALQARLRGPNGCPWDREQTHESLRKFLVEEVYEALDAMESGDSKKFASELGDLLLQVVFHSILAQERGHFGIEDVIESVHTKMIRRHPHVFGNVTAKTSAAVLKNWEEIKREERAEARDDRADVFEDSVVAEVPRSLPAVLEAYQLTRRAAHVGFDWENLAGVLEKLDEEKREIESKLSSDRARRNLQSIAADSGRFGELEEEIGDLLFVCVNVARFLGFDPEIALKKANSKFKRRFQWMESAAARKGRKFAELPRDEKERLWDRSKLQQ